jgi:hypothetical protein
VVREYIGGRIGDLVVQLDAIQRQKRETAWECAKIADASEHPPSAMMAAVLALAGPLSLEDRRTLARLLLAATTEGGCVMVACRKRTEPKPPRRAQRCGEGRRSAQFRPRVDPAPTDRFAVHPREDNTLTPAVAQDAAQEPLPQSKRSTLPPCNRSARQTRPTGLRVATSRVLEELARIAFADIGDVFDQHGAVIPFADLPPGIRSAIAEYRVRHYRNGTNTDSVRLHSKLPALTALGRHLGIFGGSPDRATRARLLLADPQPKGDVR